jgi:hypothetical protein
MGFGPQGKQLISASPNEIIVWDVETGKALRVIDNLEE